jgi:hypothetical protein
MAPPEEIGQPLERSVRKRPTDERNPTAGAPGSANPVFHPCLLCSGQLAAVGPDLWGAGSPQV